MTYNINFDRSYIECNNFLKQDAYCIKIGIEQGRLSNYLGFCSFANISFDKEDKKHDLPIVTEVEAYDKNTTNCIVFNVGENPYGYDKLFVYHTDGKVSGYYGYVFVNTKTNDHVHRYFINDEMTSFFNVLSEALSNMHDRHKFFNNN